MPFFAVLDACVLYPIHLANTLLRCAEATMYWPLWSPDILAELRRNLVRNAQLQERKADRRINDMTSTFPDSLVTDYEYWIPQLTNHPKDRHVLAVAIQSGAEIIVTSNRRHFPPTALAPFNIIAQSPDTFLCELLFSDPGMMRQVIEQQAKDHTNPPLDVPDLLEHLERTRTAPQFADRVRTRLLADQL